MLSGRPVRRQLWHGTVVVGTALVEDDAAEDGGGGGNGEPTGRPGQDKGTRRICPRVTIRPQTQPKLGPGIGQKRTEKGR